MATRQAPEDPEETAALEKDKIREERKKVEAEREAERRRQEEEQGRRD